MPMSAQEIPVDKHSEFSAAARSQPLDAFFAVHELLPYLEPFQALGCHYVDDLATLVAPAPLSPSPPLVDFSAVLELMKVPERRRLVRVLRKHSEPSGLTRAESIVLD